MYAELSQVGEVAEVNFTLTTLLHINKLPKSPLVRLVSTSPTRILAYPIPDKRAQLIEVDEVNFLSITSSTYQVTTRSTRLTKQSTNPMLT